MPENLCSIFFDNKGVEFINIVRILRDPDTELYIYIYPYHYIRTISTTDRNL